MTDNSKHCDCGDECDNECGDECTCQDEAINPSQFDAETQAQIQQIQILEQNFEQIMQQKHLFNMEITETDLALKEVEKSEGEVFKIVGGQVVIKTTKDKLVSDLKHKKDLLELRMKSIDSQEKGFSDKIEELRQSIMSKINPQN